MRLKIRFNFFRNLPVVAATSPFPVRPGTGVGGGVVVTFRVPREGRECWWSW